MIKGASIICFAHDWGGDPTSKTHIMRILSRENRILWVNSIGMRKPTASSRDVRRLFTKLAKAFQGCLPVQQNLYVWNPLVLPLPGVAEAERFNTWILTVSLRSIMRRLDFDRPILWTFMPNVNGLVGRLGERMVIYHCVDEYGAFSGVPRAALERMERDLMGKADLVFTSSEELCRDRLRHNPRTYFVPHGADLDHFAGALDPERAVPAEIQTIRRPIIGFFGLLADWVDLSLIKQMALSKPEWSIVLIGKATTDLEPLKGIKNIHWLGQKPYGMLPGYCKGFDVGIIPFRINELTRKANPLKLREYLAAGLPVVSTDLPEVTKYRGLIRVAAGAEDFVREVGAALGERGDPYAQRRIDAMRLEGWEARVEQLCSHIQSVEVS